MGVGVYNWVVTYSGDLTASTPGSVSPCGSETFNIVKADSTVVTTMTVSNSQGVLHENAANNQHTAAGHKISDRANITVPGSNAYLEGEITFKLYYNQTEPADCTVGTLLSVQTVVIPAGMIPGTAKAYAVYTPDDVLMDKVGYYDWVVTYSGSANLNGSVSGCGQERIITEMIGLKAETEMFAVVDGESTVIGMNTDLPSPILVGDRLTLTPTSPSQRPFVPLDGTVTYELYKTANCTEANRVFAQTVDVGTDGSIPEVQLEQPLTAYGAYNWKVIYTPAEGSIYTAAISDCVSEQFFVTGGIWGVHTAPQATYGDVTRTIGWNTWVPQGASVFDRAYLVGDVPAGADSGTVVFKLYKDNACANTPVFTSSPQPMTAGTTDPATWVGDKYTIAQRGVYYWQATFTTEGHDNPVNSVCERERFQHQTQDLGFSTMTTVMFTTDGETSTVLPHNTYITPGNKVYDTVSFKTGEYASWPAVQPQGKLVYRLYDITSTGYQCTGTPVFEREVTIGEDPASPSPVHTVLDTVSGAFAWRVQYIPASGNTNFGAYTTVCLSEVFGVRGALKSVTTEMYTNGEVLKNGGSVNIMQPVLDTATLTWSEGSPAPTGTVWFYLYAGSECAGPDGLNPRLQMSMGGKIGADGKVTANNEFVLFSMGQYSIQAEYGGDSNYAPMKSECGTENFSVVGTAKITTRMYSGIGYINQGGQIPLGIFIRDEASVVGFVAPGYGTLRFELFKGETCVDTPVFLQEQEFNTGYSLSLAQGKFNTSWYTPEEAGVYNWVVTWIPADESQGTIISPCGDETFNVVPKIDRSVGLSCVHNSQTDLSSYRIIISRPLDGLPDVDPNLMVYVLPFDRDGNLMQDQAVIYQNWDSAVGETTPDLAGKDWGYIRVMAMSQYSPLSIDWAGGGCNVMRVETMLTTVMYAVSETEVWELPHTGTTVTEFQVKDTAVFPEDRIPTSGTLTYTLHKDDATCSRESVVGEPQVLEIADGVIPESAPVSIAAGTYYWVVEFSGDVVFKPATSGCGAEIFIATDTPVREVDLVKSGKLDLGENEVANPGDIITYTFTVTNDGNTPLYGLTVTDPLEGLVWTAGNTIASLTPGQSVTLEATYAITQADIEAGNRHNLAFVADTPIDPETPPVTDEDPEDVPVPQVRDVDLVKRGTLDLGQKEIANPGDIISYTFTVTNTGNVTLYGLTVTDPLVGLTWTNGNTIASLDPGESVTLTATYAITKADIDAGNRHNLATVTDTPTDPETPPVTDEDPEDVPIPQPDSTPTPTPSPTVPATPSPTEPVTPTPTAPTVDELPKTGTGGTSSSLMLLVGALGVVAVAALGLGVNRRQTS